MNRQQIDKIIELLESARKHAPMYIGSYDVEAARHFCDGIGMACRALSETAHVPLHLKVMQERGWNRNSNTLYNFPDDMKQRGFTQQMMVEELFDVEIESWKRYAQEPEQ